MGYSFFPFDSKYQGVTVAGLPYGDRDADSADFAAYDADRYTDGVNAYGNINAMLVSGGAGMSIVIASGAAYIHGRRIEIDATGVTLALAVGGAQPRIDRIPLTLDTHEALRSIVPSVKVGTPDASPAAPTLTRNTDAVGETWQLSLARILVPANATSITQCTIIDERSDTAVCGWSLSRRAPQPPMPGDAVLHSDIGVAGGVAAYAHNHTAGQLPALSSAVDQTGTTVGANQAAVKAAYDRGTAGVNAATTADAKAQAVINQLNAVGTAGGPAFTLTKTEWAAGIPQYTPLVILFNGDVENATLKVNTFPAYAIVNTYGGNAKFKAGFHTLIFNGANFFKCSAGGGLDLPASIAAGSTVIYFDDTPKTVYSQNSFTTQYSVTMKKAGTYTFDFSIGSPSLTGMLGSIWVNGVQQTVADLSTAYGGAPVRKQVDLAVPAGALVECKIKSSASYYSYGYYFAVKMAWSDITAKISELV